MGECGEEIGRGRCDKRKQTCVCEGRGGEGEAVGPKCLARMGSYADEENFEDSNNSRRGVNGTWIGDGGGGIWEGIDMVILPKGVMVITGLCGGLFCTILMMSVGARKRKNWGGGRRSGEKAGEDYGSILS